MVNEETVEIAGMVVDGETVGEEAEVIEILTAVVEEDLIVVVPDFPPRHVETEIHTEVIRHRGNRIATCLPVVAEVEGEIVEDHLRLHHRRPYLHDLNQRHPLDVAITHRRDRSRRSPADINIETGLDHQTDVAVTIGAGEVAEEKGPQIALHAEDQLRFRTQVAHARPDRTSEEEPLQNQEALHRPPELVETVIDATLLLD